MNTLLAAVDRRYRAPAPAERLATVRVLVGAFSVIYLLVRAPVMANFTRFAPERFEPVGAAVVLDAPLPAALVWALWGATVLSGVCFTLGVRYRVTAPLFAALLLWVTSYRNSWGMVFHSDNLFALHALALGLCPAAGASLSLDTRGAAAPPDDGRFGWPLKLLCWMAVITYVIAGLSKLRNSGFEWAEGEILRNYIAYDGARKDQIGSIHSPLGALLVQHAWPFPVIGVLTFVLELGAPIAMLNTRLTRWWVAGIYGFHVGVLAVMAIAFPYPLSGVAYAPFLRAERLWRLRGLAPIARWLRGAPPATAGR